MPATNIVLVHGGFVDGSGWEGVHKLLRKDRFNVSIEEGVESVGRIEAGWFRQRHLLDDLGPRLQFPHHLEFFTQGVVFDRRQGDEMLCLRCAHLNRAVWQSALGDLAHDVLPLPHTDELALLWQRGSWHRNRRLILRIEC